LTGSEKIMGDKIIQRRGRGQDISEVIEKKTEIRLSWAIDEILASRARSEVTAGEIARLKVETRSVLEQIETNLKQHVA
jgi:hypothetical protein